MSKSVYDDRFQKGDALIDKIRDDQLERLRRVGKDLWHSQLADWEDLARAEDSVRSEYVGRYLFELLQNAIKDEIEPLFKHNGRIEDYYSWKQEFNILNLSMRSFEEDVMEKLRNFKHGIGVFE